MYFIIATEGTHRSMTIHDPKAFCVHSMRTLSGGYSIPPGCQSFWVTWGRVYFADLFSHHRDVILSVMASQIADFSVVCSTVCSGADQRKHQSSASLAFVRGVHRWPVNSPHKGPVTRKMFSFDDVIMVPLPSHIFASIVKTVLLFEYQIHTLLVKMVVT